MAVKLDMEARIDARLGDFADIADEATRRRVRAKIEAEDAAAEEKETRYEYKGENLTRTVKRIERDMQKARDDQHKNRSKLTVDGKKSSEEYQPTRTAKTAQKTPVKHKKTPINIEALKIEQAEAKGQLRLFDAKGRHGGARKGAGRPKGEGDPKTVWAVRVTAAEKALLLDYLLEIRDRATIKEQ